MSSRIPLPYGPEVLELFRNPKNVGKMKSADASAVAGSLACEDMIAIYLKVNSKTLRVERATFESYGCAANIAAASILTEMIKGKSLEEAWKEVSEELGGLPAMKYHCGILAVGALRRAIRNYFSKTKRPNWLPEEPTVEERQAIEEEMMEVMKLRGVNSGSLGDRLPTRV